MANTIRIKRRASGAPGAPLTLANAEVAFNEVDDILYYGKGAGGSGGSATTIEAIGGRGAFVSLSGTQTLTGEKTLLLLKVPIPVGGDYAVNKTYVDGAVTSGNAGSAVKLATARTINGVLFDGTANITIVDATKAPIASPGLTGVPTSPTAALGTNTTQIANTAFVRAEIMNVVGAAPAALDTLREISDALGNDANYAATMTSQLAGKQPLDATLTALAGVATVADRLIYATGVDAFAVTAFSAFGRSLIDDANSTAARTTLGLGSMALQAANAVAISGGTIDGIDFDGGTF